jgi:hypothetical protein
MPLHAQWIDDSTGVSKRSTAYDGLVFCCVTRVKPKNAFNGLARQNPPIVMLFHVALRGMKQVF